MSLYARHAAYVGEMPLFSKYRAKNSMKNQEDTRSVPRTNRVNATVLS